MGGTAILTQNCKLKQAQRSYVKDMVAMRQNCTAEQGGSLAIPSSAIVSSLMLGPKALP